MPDAAESYVLPPGSTNVPSPEMRIYNAVVTAHGPAEAMERPPQVGNDEQAEGSTSPAYAPDPVKEFKRKSSFKRVWTAAVATTTMHREMMSAGLRNRSIFGTVGPGDEFKKEELGRWSKAYVIGVESKFRLYWDISQIFVLSYVALAVPLGVAFGVSTYGFAFWIEVLVDIYFYFDIVVNFFSALKIENDLDIVYVENLSSIACAYIKGWLTVDILACLPLDYVSRTKEGILACSFKVGSNPCADAKDSNETTNTGSGKALKLLKILRIFRLLKLLRLSRLKRILLRWQDRLVYWEHVVTVVKVFGVIMLFSHWMGCLYGSVYDWSADPDFADEDPDLTTKWVTCFYWAVQTTTTVGYGDRTSDDVHGQLVSVLGMSVGGFIFSWLMSNIFSLLNPDPTKQKQSETMQYVLTYLRNQNLPREIAARVLSFYKKRAAFHFDEKKLLSNLPFRLRQEIFDYLYAGIIRSIAIFKDQEDHFINELCHSVSPVTMNQLELVYQREDVVEEMYIIIEGKIAITEDMDKKHIVNGMLINQTDLSSLTKTTYNSTGQYFGEGGVFYYSKRTEYAVARELTRLLSIPIGHFQQLLTLYPDVKHRLLVAWFQRLSRFCSPATQDDVCRSLGLVECVGADGLIRKDYKVILLEKLERGQPLYLEPGTNDDAYTESPGYHQPAQTEDSSFQAMYTNDYEKEAGDYRHRASPSQEASTGSFKGFAAEQANVKVLQQISALMLKMDTLTSEVGQIKDGMNRMQTDISKLQSTSAENNNLSPRTFGLLNGSSKTHLGELQTSKLNAPNPPFNSPSEYLFQDVERSTLSNHRGKGVAPADLTRTFGPLDSL